MADSICFIESMPPPSRRSARYELGPRFHVDSRFREFTWSQLLLKGSYCATVDGVSEETNQTVQHFNDALFTWDLIEN